MLVFGACILVFCACVLVFCACVFVFGVRGGIVTEGLKESDTFLTAGAVYGGLRDITKLAWAVLL